jgi:hypothetical protein
MLWVNARSLLALGATSAILIGSSADRPAVSSSAHAATTNVSISNATGQERLAIDLICIDMSDVTSSFFWLPY